MSGKVTRLAALVAFVLLASGCFTSAKQMFQENMDCMAGLPASSLFDRLGIPESEGQVAGRKFYVWDTYNSGSISIPQQHTGTLYNPYSQPFSSTYTYTTYQQVQYSHFCKFRVFVDSQDRIITYDFEGNEGGCRRLASQLSQ